MKGLIQHKVFVFKFSDESEAKRALGETKDKPLVIDGRKVKKKSGLEKLETFYNGIVLSTGSKNAVSSLRRCFCTSASLSTNLTSEKVNGNRYHLRLYPDSVKCTKVSQKVTS